MINFNCPSCGQPMQIDNSNAGATVNCIKCGQAMVVPPAAPVAAQMHAMASVPPPRPQKQPSAAGFGLGIAGIATGAVGLVFGLVPFCGCGAIPVSVIGAILAGVGLIIALTQSGKGLVVSIVGLLISAAAVVTPFLATGGFMTLVGHEVEKAGRQVMTDLAKQQVSDDGQLAAALKKFKRDVGRYPTSEEGLRALIDRPEPELIPDWHGPYLPIGTDLTDPWGRDYEYQCPGEHNYDAYDLSSAGPDREYGTADDIGNW